VPDHFSVYFSIGTVVENATGSDHQGYADESRRESQATNPPFGGKKKATCRGDQVAENDPRFGNEQIVFDPFRHSHISAFSSQLSAISKNNKLAH
jgi:hypothetical protein